MRTWMWIVVMALVGLLAYGAGATSGYFGALHSIGGESSAESYDVEPDAATRIAMRDTRFSPSSLDVRAGALTEVAVTNEDQALHTFTYESDGRTHDHVLRPGESTRILVLFEEPGTVEFRCKPHDGMRGAIHVEA